MPTTQVRFGEEGKPSIDASSQPTILCFSHLRWDFVYQRPQHLLSRAGMLAQVFYFEEPVFADVEVPTLRVQADSSGVQILTPVVPHGVGGVALVEVQRTLLDQLLQVQNSSELILWYYTPMALAFSDQLSPLLTVYDCMDQLSAFRDAPAGLHNLEAALFRRADVVFTGGRSLFESKRGEHRNVHLFPSSVDRAHFEAARKMPPDPKDQESIAHPRIGFFGVLDERLDRELLREAAKSEPSWQFILIGPVVKISKEELPQAPNIHYLGTKEYAALPSYIAHWDVAMMPFAQNESTRFISPTKTPEYLAAGKQVVSTPIVDVVEPYGRRGFVRIAKDSEEFCAAIRSSLSLPEPGWLSSVDEFLHHTSWDQTFKDMWSEVRGRGMKIPGNAAKEEVIHV
jgi:glycosyltransferase involved in cell wall biosynthesis